MNGLVCPGAKIVVDAIFEKAVIRIAKGIVLTTEQRQSVQGVLCPTLPDGSSTGRFSDLAVPVEHQGSLSFAEKIKDHLKRQKTGNDALASQNINLDILSGTSVSCERLFSFAKHILTDTRNQRPQLSLKRS